MMGPVANDFVKLVKEIIEISQYASGLTMSSKDHGADLIGQDREGKTVLFEVKLYRSKRVAVGVVARAFQQLESALIGSPGSRGVLVMTADASPYFKELQISNPSLSILDFSNLRSLASISLELLSRFDEIMRSVSPLPRSSADLDQAGETSDAAEITQDASKRPIKIVTQTALPLKGDSIARRIEATSPGKEQATSFEKEMMTAIKYLFEEDIASLSAQKATDGGISRFDAIGRVASQHDFWQIVAGHFRSRYVIFEFKNYEGRIKQGQIYTTEKYLYANAMRSTAIIVSRLGADKNARAAALGALRESRKLIINITSLEICAMLRAKDDGNDPNDTLLEIIDALLIGANR